MARKNTGLILLFLAVLGVAVTGSCMILGVAAQAQTPSPPVIDAPLHTLPTDSPDYAPGRLLVAFASETHAKQRSDVLATHGLESIGRLEKMDISIVRVPEGQELEIAERLSQLPAIHFAEPDYIVHALGDPDDTYYSSYQWNLSIINGPAAWDVSTGSRAITIAIADTGIDLTHPDLAGKIVTGYDFVHNDSVAQDDHGHGTHCAGIAAAISNNSLGVAGVNWQAQLMPLKVLDSLGSGYDSDVANSIIWAVDHGATVVSLSLGGTDQSYTLSQAVEYAHNHDVVIVAAAGNEYEKGNPTIYPAAFDHVIGVAATGAYDEHAYYSNTGSYVDIAAPGGNARMGYWVLSTYWQSGNPTYDYAQGTSMATPHVAGLAALIQSLDPSLSSDEVESIIESTALDLGGAGRDDVFGWGRIDAAAALAAVSDPLPTPTPTSTPSCLVESPHPYGNYINQTWTVINPDAGAAHTRVHFFRLETEAGYDFVILRDGTGTEFYRYDGSYQNGLWSESIPGNTVQVQLVSDAAVTAWGFCLDVVETVETPASDVLLHFSPQQSQVAQGMTFRVDMMLSTETQPIDSIDTVITFDPSILQVVDDQGNPTDEIMLGDALPLPLANDVDNAAGRITFGAGRGLGDDPPAGDLHLATIRFRANAQTLSPSGTPLIFDNSCEAYYGGAPVLDNSENGAVIVQASWFTGQVVLQGRGNPPGNRWTDYGLTVTFLDAAGDVVDTSETATDENGYFAVLTPPSGTFDLKIKGSHSLSNLRESVTLPAGDVIDLGILREGDANNDDRVSGIDFSLLATAYATEPGDQRWDPRVDFNGDERVSAADFSLLASNYALQGPLAVATEIVSATDIYPRMMNLRLDPLRQIVDRNGVIELTIFLDTEDRLVDTVDVLLSFDPATLTVVDVNDMPAERIIPGDSLPLELANRVDYEAGEIAYSAGIALGAKPVTGQLAIATIRFKALSHTRNGLRGTPIEFQPGTEAYLAGEPQLNTRVGSAIVVTIGPRAR